jgi:hypothetical protein
MEKDVFLQNRVATERFRPGLEEVNPVKSGSGD